MGRVRALSLGLVVTLGIATGAAAAAWTTLRAGNVTARAPAGWELVEPADSATIDDPRTVLVAGTEDVTSRRSECQVAAYHVPADGAAVVVLRWAGKAPDWVTTDRQVLADLRLRRQYFECWDDRGAAAQIAIKGRAYQVNVLVGDRATQKTTNAALAVARSVDAVR
jgi:hypothetical protein